MKVTKSLKDWGIFFTGTTENIIYKKGGFLGSLMRVDLQLTKMCSYH